MSAPGSLGPRVAVAVIGLPVVFGAFYLGGTVLGVLLGVVAVLGVREFYELSRLQGDRPFALLGSAATAGVIAAATVHPTFEAFAVPAVWILVVTTGAALLLSLFLRWPGGSPSGALGSTLSGLAYVGLPLTFMIFLRELPEGIPGLREIDPVAPLGFVLLPLAVTWACDTAAYFVGSAIGRIRLAPSMSPKKSVEGAIAGVVAGTGAAALVANWLLADLPSMALSVATAAWIGAIVAVAGQVGDLVESVLKRRAGVKDSGRLLPGHGGMLDRLDALLWTFPVTWALLAVVGVVA